MIGKIHLPDLGGAVDQAAILRWIPESGAPFEEGDPLLEVTVDKATIEIPAAAGGRLRHLCALPGDLVPVGGLIAMTGEPDDGIPPAVKEVKYPRARPDFCMYYRSALDRPDGPADPLDPMRTVVARRMCRSKAEAPHFYVRTVVDMTGCVELRKRLKQEKRRVSYNDMIVKACALALRRHPRVATAWTEGGYVARDRMHVGFAVAVEPDGLLTPVVRDADRLELTELATRSKDLADRARKHRLTPDEYTGGVFTVSNLGGFDVDAFTAIINPGESAILAVGRVADKPVAEDGACKVRPLMEMTLSSDHRVVDGVLAARFNGTVKKLLEAPDALLPDAG